MPDNAKPLTGFGSGVMDLALRQRGEAVLVVYALQIANDIWIIRAFQKESKPESNPRNKKSTSSTTA